MKWRFTALLFVLCLICCTHSAAQTSRALLIGIDTYQPKGTSAQHPPGCTYGRCELDKFEDLEGSVNDARAMAELLTSPKFGFPTQQVVVITNPSQAPPRPGIVTLPSSQTTRDGILAAMQKYLVDLPQSGDTVVFYIASHGSLRINSKGNKLSVFVNGKLVHADSTIVPADAYKGGYDVRDREMTRIFNAALDKGVHLTVIFDSCHSGGATRGLAPKYRQRRLAYDPRDIAEAPDVLPNGGPRLAPTERPDNPALVFSAAQQDQAANESLPSESPEPHGAFTAALLEALQILPADAPASLVYQRVKAVLEGNAVPDQEPDLDATAGRRQQPLFGSGGATSASSGKVRTAALKTDEDGKVWLDIGRVSGIGVGSEFTSMDKNSKGQTIKLRVTSLKGIARASSQVITPPGAAVAAGEVFELAKWIPADSAPLRFWLSPSNLSEGDILAAAEQIKAAGVSSVSDPAAEPWTDILSWDGTSWTFQHAAPSPAAISGTGPAASIDLDAKPSVPIILGAKLTAEELKKHISANTKLWVNLPPSKELAAKLALNDKNSSAQATPDLTAANYILTGTLTEDGPAYAWFHKSEFDAGPRASVAADHSPGCSATSQYPVRSDWVVLADATVIDDGAGALNKSASLLAKVHGWLQLADSPTGASTADYYKLEILKASNGKPLAADQPAQQSDELKMALQSDKPVTEQRWVYVLDIDCRGQGSLLYPLDYSENRFPNNADNPNQFVLPGSRTLRIDSPFGLDTLILLTTAQALPDPYALNFKGAATRGARGAESPLQRLLGDTSGGTRGPTIPMPTDWGIAVMTLRSIPKDAAK